MDHWAFSYGLLMVGLSECLLVGWVLGADKIRTHLNGNSMIKLGVWFDVLIKYVIPVLLLLVLGYSIWGEVENGIFGTDYADNYSDKYSFMRYSPPVILAFWFISCTVVAFILARRGSFAKDE